MFGAAVTALPCPKILVRQPADLGLATPKLTTSGSLSRGRSS